MGLTCCGNKNEFLNFTEKNNNNNTFINYCAMPMNDLKMQKIKLIQNNFRIYLSKKILKKLLAKNKRFLNLELENKKLINEEAILNCESEKYYNKLLSTGKIKKYMEYLKENQKIKSNLESIEKYAFIIPYFVVKSSNIVYKGSWNSKKKFHGYGVLYEFNNQKMMDSRTEGIFINGMLNGYAYIFFSNQEIIKGLFSLNKLNGYGTYQRNDGSLYEGMFYNGFPQGSGRETFADGSFFDGIYINGKKKNGKFEWKDGSWYKGDFENDMFNGVGIYKWSNKKSYDGQWKEGKMNGKGKLIYSDGSYYEGDFINGKRSGSGKYVWAPNKFYKGEWKDDKQNGMGLYYKNGKKAQGLWVDGKLLEDSSSFISGNINQRSSIGSINLSSRIKNRYTHNNNMNDLEMMLGHNDEQAENFGKAIINSANRNDRISKFNTKA